MTPISDDEDDLPAHWRNPPQRGTAVPSRAARMPGGGVIDGWQAVCAQCEELPWTVGPWRRLWIDAVLDAWLHNTEGWPFERHPAPAKPVLTWDELLQTPAHLGDGRTEKETP